MSDIERQLKKGVLDILILKLISARDMYGYELMKILEERSKSYYKLKEGSLYPVLYRLEDAALIESYRYEDKSNRAVPRKYYKITKKGQETLNNQIRTWELFVTSSNHVLE